MSQIACYANHFLRPSEIERTGPLPYAGDQGGRSTMTTTTAPLATRTLDGALAAFLRAQEGKNRRPATLAAYRTDLTQFVAWLRETNGTIEGPGDIGRYDVA